jgi:hypothetical protein
VYEIVQHHGGAMDLMGLNYRSLDLRSGNYTIGLLPLIIIALVKFNLSANNLIIIL